MQSEIADQPELSCQWCTGTIPRNAPVCSTCGAARPRDDLVAPGFTQPEEPLAPFQDPDSEPVDPEDDEARARQILKDLDAYIPETAPSGVAKTSRDTGDDIVIIIGMLVIGGILGGLAGWFLLSPLLHQFFSDVVGVETGGPESFRRLGGFFGGLVAMLFAALAGMILRR